MCCVQQTPINLVPRNPFLNEMTWCNGYTMLLSLLALPFTMQEQFRVD
jgi:hypothetical protein